MPKKRTSGRNKRTPINLGDYELNNKSNKQINFENSENGEKQEDDVSSSKEKSDEEADNGGRGDVNMEKSVEMKKNESRDDMKVDNESSKVDNGNGSEVVKLDDIRKISYANVVKKNADEIEKSLYYVPTEMNDKGEEIVIFDEDLVKEGCEKWKLTACGFFLGCSMSLTEMRYNLIRMWGKLGLEEIPKDNKDICYFKFKNNEGMSYVLEQSPWMVNGKPLFVQEWNPEVCIEKTEPNKLPIWVNMRNVPLEAWSVKGISSLASRLGYPIMMDRMTAMMCKSGRGGANFARVLIEIEAHKGILDKIEVVYKDNLQNIKQTKFVNVEYTWKPMVCKNCNVFGHNGENCRHGNQEKDGNKINENAGNNEEIGRKLNNEGWIKSKKFEQKVRWERKVNKEKPKTPVNVENKKNGNIANEDSVKNKFDILEKEKEEELDFLQKLKVEWFVKSDKMPTEDDKKDWFEDMQRYFKERWEDKKKGKEKFDEENDFVNDEDEVENEILADEMNGGDNQILN